jgi:dTDP-4-amino-4,6-dideoxygalactose transaminase
MSWSNTLIPYDDLKKVNAGYREDLIKGFQDVLDGGWYILGNAVKTFEEEFAKWNGVKYAIGVASGLDALILSLLAAEMPAGSEILVPSNTYIATILAIIKAGFKPVLVEPDPISCNINSDWMEASITSKTKAVIIVHLYGKPCRMDRIVEICGINGLFLVEDCAQSHGAAFMGKKTGTFGQAGAFSFYPTKNLGALGDGGAVVTDDDNLAEVLRSLRNYGSSKKYHNDRIGLNSRLDEVQAAFLSVKLKSLQDVIDHKRRLATLYDERLDNRFLKPQRNSDEYDSFHIYQIRHPDRNSLRDYLKENGVGTEIHYPIPPHKQKAYQGYWDGQFSISERIHSETLSLPCSVAHSREDILRVVDLMNAWNGLS